MHYQLLNLVKRGTLAGPECCHGAGSEGISGMLPGHALSFMGHMAWGGDLHSSLTTA